MTIYRAGTLKRERRTNAALNQLDQQIIDVLVEDHPQSVRHVFYRMTNPRLPEPVEKSERGYRHVQDRIVKLRRTGRLPFSWIADATRRGYHTPTYSDSSDFLRRMSGLYRADLWRDAACYCEVWTESRSIAGVVQDDCEALAVSLYPAGGFTSLTLAYQAAETINYFAADKPAVIFYIGDYDPAGVLIDVAIERELRDHLEPGIELSFERIAITPGQIIAFDLPTKPRKETDRRALHIRETVEAEAMPAHMLRLLLRNRIEQLLPPEALSIAKVEEASAREHFDRMAELLGGAS
ncbi:hypothetical protein LA66_00120 [Aureimonas altamirensis]|uniref:Uncharacterized protein n=1 Tax=Aureimonas altamirensis TaxID=370622 RepID=A0A0B1Q8A9_9HYPH|nr:hypothetical protein [Aureimonas altamirensis]KHJ55132.1 hypothetical protein LA66_00120 [Aureimonas altamirensis]